MKNNSNELVFILMLLSVILGICLIVSWLSYHDYVRQSIGRGYAIYCPTDGRLSWIGECEE